MIVNIIGSIKEDNPMSPKSLDFHFLICYIVIQGVTYAANPNYDP